MSPPIHEELMKCKQALAPCLLTLLWKHLDGVSKEPIYLRINSSICALPPQERRLLY